jgi:hypothetical protein
MASEINQMQNKRGEWVPSIPLPFYEFRLTRWGAKRCNCGLYFWREKNYEAHYALVHIVLGEEPL